MTNKQATQAELAALAKPDALAALAILHDNGWLTANLPEVETFFQDDPKHLAAVVMRKEANYGGLAGVLQVTILLAFAVLALVMASFSPTMPLTLFAMWAVLGVTAALIVRWHPGFLALLGGKRRR
ncbi:hypothetical protein [Burkholderia ambifaria]|uniref:hypothetical protein n=1 Tax=Burkholderia ambifaria TaxID=152480 RepID=UPI000F80D6A1|nr:hypothetical protein [Burkholderia ambifaria]